MQQTRPIAAFAAALALVAPVLVDLPALAQPGSPPQGGAPTAPPDILVVPAPPEPSGPDRHPPPGHPPQGLALPNPTARFHSPVATWMWMFTAPCGGRCGMASKRP